jgi:putative membrane protein
MKRLTMDMVLAGVLAAAPLAWAQGEAPGSMQNRNDTTPAAPRPTPSTTRRNTPPYPGDEPAPTQRVPPDVPPAGMPTPATPSTTTGSERAGNEPVDATPTAGVNDQADGDVKLVQKFHEANQKEIDMAQLASDKGKSARVKSYARKLVSDHKAADRQLMAYASKKGLTSRLEQTTQAPSTSAGNKAGDDMHARLMGETGDEFDHDFVAAMVDDHDQAIEMVRSARDSATDPQLRDLFDGVLPKLEKHRKMAQQLLDKHTKS